MSERVRVLPGQTKNSLRVVDIALDTLRPDKNQPRQYFDQRELDELAASIKRTGLIQPITVTRDPKAQGKYIVVAGERRYRAHQQLERKTIPAIVVTGNTDEIAIIENLQRQDLSPIEEALALARLREKHGYTHEQLGQAVGKARSTVTNLLKINDLPKRIKTQAVERGTTRSILIEISKLTPDKQREVWREHTKNGLTVKSTRNKKRGKQRTVERNLGVSMKTLSKQLDDVVNLGEPLSDEVYESVLTFWADCTKKLERIGEHSSQNS